MLIGMEGMRRMAYGKNGHADCGFRKTSPEDDIG